HLLYNLLFLDQERAHHAVFDTVATSRPTVGALHRLLWPRNGGVFAWAEGGDLLIGPGLSMNLVEEFKKGVNMYRETMQREGHVWYNRVVK
ncbi:hypothetical protein MMC22_011118, partial [Lobaria immixta]|nr:hypothetical protein [Lobaria immixta]